MIKYSVKTLLAIIISCAAMPVQPAEKLTPQTEKAFQQCRKKLIAAQKLEVLNDMKWDSPKEPYIVAGPTFFSMPIDAKEGFVETVNCFLNSGTQGCINFDVRNYLTGKPVGRFERCKFSMN
jgi:histone acetyltransferase (RNA polymerase elongator complex component)